MSTRAFITGVSGTELTAAEREFIRAERPWGFILFKRNVATPAQVTALVSELRAVAGAADAPVVDWARTFDDWCKETLDARDWDRLRDYPGSAPELRMNHPTEEHFRPLLMVAGAASTALYTVQYPIAGFEYGSLSRRSIQFS